MLEQKRIEIRILPRSKSNLKNPNYKFEPNFPSHNYRQRYDNRNELQVYREIGRVR